MQARIPLTSGGTNSQLLRWAGAHADVVGLTGFGRTLPHGHSHQVRWRLHQLEAQLRQVNDGAGERTDRPQLEAVVQVVAVTDDASAVLAQTARDTGVGEADLLAMPFLLIDTVEEIAWAVRDHEKRWVITRCMVRERALEAAPGLIPRVAGQSH